jgi:hypothetical protein
MRYVCQTEGGISHLQRLSRFHDSAPVILWENEEFNVVSEGCEVILWMCVWRIEGNRSGVEWSDVVNCGRKKNGDRKCEDEHDHAKKQYKAI